MRYPDVDEYFRLLDLQPISPTELKRIYQPYASQPAAQRFQATAEAFRRRGDDGSNRAFYRCFYGEQAPGVNLSWGGLYACENLPYEWATLPELAHFCAAHEPRQYVLDAGCGDGLALCYLARQFSHAGFVGVDRCPEALAGARRRVERLGVSNVRLIEDDVFAPRHEWGGSFDGLILRNVVDDVRMDSTTYLDARFYTTTKLSALRPRLRINARVWVSLTPYPSSTLEFEEQVQRDLQAAGFTAPPAQRVNYALNDRSYVHLIWTLCPTAQQPKATPGLTPRPEYVPRYHYLCGYAIPVEDLARAEQCYINLSNPTDCPRCSTSGARVDYTGGPDRTLRNQYKIWASVYSCGFCSYGYLAIEVID